jgi:CubicO group peptidase (beta-lactamase class C family)
MEIVQMKKNKLKIMLSFFLIQSSFLLKAELPTITPEQANYDAGKLSKVDEELEALYYDGLIPNYVVAAAKDGKIFYSATMGETSIGSGIPVNINTRYQVASMTKPLVSTVAFKLIEDRLFALETEIADHLPMFSDMFVAPGGSLENLEEANRKITVLDLITHTSGLSYGSAVTGTGDVANLYDELAPTSSCNSNEEAMDILSQIPLIAQPGTQWNYSVGIDVLGAFIAEVTGKSLYQNISEIILEPLGMSRSSFQYSESVLSSEVSQIGISPLAGATPIGRIAGSEIDWKINTGVENPLGSCAPTSPDFKFESGGGGMTMSVNDYLTFLSMIVNGGTFDGVTILQPESVDRMLTEQVSDMEYPAMIGNNIFGAGFGISLDEEESSKVDYYTWGGIFNTGFWIEPSDKSVGVIATAVFPGQYNQTIALEQKFDEARLPH